MFSDLMRDLGYCIEDDAWETDGRRTYSHDSDATAPYLRSLMLLLAPVGFALDQNRIRTLVNQETGELVELEPGGFDCPGHLLHHLKQEPVA